MLKKQKRLFIFTDGGARGNPGPAAIGFLVKDNQGKIIAQEGKFIGRATNNVAEYTAVIESLKWLIGRQRKDSCFDKNSELALNDKIEFFLDSQLVVNQLNGLFKIKNSHLRQLIIKVRQLEGQLEQAVFYHYISREKNKQADCLVNQVLNKKTAAKRSP